MESEPNTKPRLTLIGLMVLILVVGGLGAFLMLPVSKTTSGAKRAHCKNQLRHIGIAMHLYADDHNGAFPSIDPVPDAFDVDPTHTVQAFALLYQLNYTDNVKIFSCPTAPSSFNDFKPGGKLQPASTSYAYDSMHLSSHAGPIIILGDCQNGTKEVSANHKGDGGFYLSIDSSVCLLRAPPRGQKLVYANTDPDGIWHRTNGYVHDTCLRRTAK